MVVAGDVACDVSIEVVEGVEVNGNGCGSDVTCDVSIEVVEGVEVKGNGCGSDVACDVSIEVVEGVELGKVDNCNVLERGMFTMSEISLSDCVSLELDVSLVFFDLGIKFESSSDS